MDISAHIWFCIALFCMLVLFSGTMVIGFNNLTGNITDNTLQDALRTALYYSRDDSARGRRGTFIINKKAFLNIVNNTNIREFHYRNLGKLIADHSGQGVQVIPDKQADTNASDGNSSHEMDYKQLSNGNQDSFVGADDNNDYVPIYAIKINVNVDGHNYYATEVVQSLGHYSWANTINHSKLKVQNRGSSSSIYNGGHAPDNSSNDLSGDSTQTNDY